jgi:hypothetical protein
MLAVALCAFSGLALAHDAENPHPVGNPSHAHMGLTGDRDDLIFESFEESVPPAGWMIMTSGAATTWEQTDMMANSGMYSAVVFFGPQGAFQDEWLVTSALDFSAGVAPMLEFYEAQAWWDGYGLEHQICVSTTVPDDPGAYDVVASYTPDTHTIPAEFGGPPVTVDLSAYVGNATVYVAFRYLGDWADTWYIDDVRIYDDVVATDSATWSSVKNLYR